MIILQKLSTEILLYRVLAVREESNEFEEQYPYPLLLSLYQQLMLKPLHLIPITLCFFDIHQSQDVLQFHITM